jgi:hypothetical protein
VSAHKRRVVDLPGGRYWALYGLRGVVEFNVQDFAEYGHHDVDSRAAVGMHSPRPTHDGQRPCEGCSFLEGACYVEMSDAGGVHIAEEWENAGFDDEIIWRWLTEYYDEPRTWAAA